jgi:hypothetical protein
LDPKTASHRQRLVWVLIPVVVCLALFVWLFRPRKLPDLPSYQLVTTSSTTLARGSTLAFSLKPSGILEGTAQVRFFVVQAGRSDPLKPELEGSLSDELRVRVQREDAFGHRKGQLELVSIIVRPDVDRDLELIATRRVEAGQGWQRLSLPITLAE